MLLLLHLDFGRGADVDDGHAAGELGEALLELLAVVVAGGVFDLALDLADAVGDVLLLAGAVDDGGVVLVDLDGLRGAELVKGGVLELEAEFLGDDFAFGAQMIAPKVRMAMSSRIEEDKEGEHGDGRGASCIISHAAPLPPKSSPASRAPGF